MILHLPRVGGEFLQNHEMLNLVAGKALKIEGLKAKLPVLTSLLHS